MRAAAWLSALCMMAAGGAAPVQAQTLATGISVSVVTAKRDTQAQTTAISAQVKNDTGKIVQSVEIRFDLYDNNGSLVGSAKGSVGPISPGGEDIVMATTPLSFVRFSASEVTTR